MTEDEENIHHDDGRLLLEVARTSHTPALDIKAAGLTTRIQELRAMAGVPQDPLWHPEGDVLAHSLLTADAAAQWCSNYDLPEVRRQIVVLAALFHDVGKSNTTRITEHRITSLGHAEEGAKVLLYAADRMRWNRTLTTAVVALVREHMVHLSVIGEPSDRAIARLSRRLRHAGTSIDEWAILVAADGASRGSAATPNRAAPWLRASSSPGDRYAAPH